MCVDVHRCVHARVTSAAHVRRSGAPRGIGAYDLVWQQNPNYRCKQNYN